MSRALLALPLLLCGNTFLIADESPRFRFEKGQILEYLVRQEIKVVETSIQEGKPIIGESLTKLTTTRRFEVKSVENGEAVLEMSITAMRQEILRRGAADKDGNPTVDKVVLDSGEAEGKEKMAAFLNKPIATVKLNGLGQVLEVKGENGSEQRFRTEPPFRIDFPAQEVAVGDAWNREFEIRLDPPVGTGEKYAAIRTCKRAEDVQGRIVVGVSTAVKGGVKVPAADMPSVIPYLWSGELYLDKSGRYRGAKLSVKGETAEHQGTGTKFAYESTYVETPVEGK